MSSLASVFNKNILMNEQTTDNTSVSSEFNSINNNTDGKSFFSESLDFAREMNTEYINNTCSLYKSILESGDNPYVIHESFSEFFEFIKKIIKKAIDFIKKLCDKFIVLLMRLISSDKYLKKHKDEFSKFTSDNEFEHKGYNFTIKEGVPKNSVLSDFAKTIGQIENLGSATVTTDVVKNAYNNLTNELDNDYYDRVRAEVLGRSGESISDSEYADELFEEFRDGKDTKEDFTVTSTIVLDAYHRFDNYEKLKKEIKKQSKDIESKYQEISKSFDKVTGDFDKTAGTYSVNIDGVQGTVNKDAITELDLWCKAKASQIQKISTIHHMAFSAKLDALKDCFKQDKTILYKALYRIKGNSKD